MGRRVFGVALALGLAVAASIRAEALLPAPDTEARGREFCGHWLGLSEPQKHAQLLAAEGSEPSGRFVPECRAATRATLRRTLDFECRNWTQLMDFEVRHVVERVLRPCRNESREPDNLAG